MYFTIELFAKSSLFIHLFMHLIGGIEERILVERIQQKDKTAFELIFNYYYAGLVVYCTQFTVDREEAESIVL